jgi:citronellol/citronellal dehydrogenase
VSLSGKTLFITGASRGIGLAIALRAARDGANIAIAAKTTEPHPKLAGTIYSAAEDIERAGGKALPLAVDVRDEASVAAAVRECAQKFGGIDICVNNASAISLAPTEQIDMRRSFSRSTPAAPSSPRAPAYRISSRRRIRTC